jgi:hypothetical protein
MKKLNLDSFKKSKETLTKSEMTSIEGGKRRRKKSRSWGGVHFTDVLISSVTNDNSNEFEEVTSSMVYSDEYEYFD